MAGGPPRRVASGPSPRLGWGLAAALVVAALLLLVGAVGRQRPLAPLATSATTTAASTPPAATSTPLVAVPTAPLAGLAVLLVGTEETELHVPATPLPTGVETGTAVFVEEGPDGVTVSMEESDQDPARQALAARMARLRRTRPSRLLPWDGGDC